MSVDQVKVLILDDDPHFTELIKKNCEFYGCHVQVASSFQDALPILISDTIHLAFIDCILPSEQGVEAVSKIRNYLGHSVHLVLMSGILSNSSISSLITSKKILGFLKKPVSEKDIENYVERVREQVCYGINDSFLLKVFDKSIAQTQKLKFLVEKENIQGAEIFVVLAGLLNSQEKGILKITTSDSHKHTVYFDKGAIKDYEMDSTDEVLKHLHSTKLISEKEMNAFKEHKFQELFDVLVDGCFIAPAMIYEIKLNTLKKLIKNVAAKKETHFQVELFVKDEFKEALNFNQEELSDYLFEEYGDEWNKKFAQLFNSSVLDLSCDFKEDSSLTYPKELGDLIIKLKSKTKLKDLPKTQDHLYKFLLYILCRGDVDLLNLKGSIKYDHLYERYKNLDQLFSGEDSNFIFRMLTNKEDIVATTDPVIKSSYRYFMKLNHTDRLAVDLPKDLVKIISTVISKLEKHSQRLLNVELKNEIAQQKKKEEVQKEVEILQQRKACESFLEKGDFSKAYSIIQGVPESSFDKDYQWKFFYLWIGLSQAKYQLKQDKIKAFMQEINQKNYDFKMNHLYYYILGLHCESKKDYTKSMTCFEKTKILEPSFKPVYESLKKTRIIIAQQSKKKSLFAKGSLFSKLNKKKQAS